MDSHLDELARGLAPILALFLIGQPIGHHAAIGVRRRLSHVNQVEVEGLACGPAIEKRLGARGETIHDENPYWDIEADYIASALRSYILILSPRKIILGGGIMDRAFLFPLIRQKVLDSLNGYVESERLLKSINEYIVPPGLGNQAGSLGAIALAQSCA